jgi:hypothetical protein
MNREADTGFARPPAPSNDTRPLRQCGKCGQPAAPLGGVQTTPTRWLGRCCWVNHPRNRS